MFAALFFNLLIACASPPAPPAAGDTVAIEYADAKGSSAFLKAHPDTVVVDVRTPGEFASGHIEGAINIDYRGAHFADEVAKLPKDKPILVHCQVGGRSRASLPAFESAGLKEVHHMDGGLGGWMAAGLPVTK